MNVVAAIEAAEKLNREHPEAPVSWREIARRPPAEGFYPRLAARLERLAARIAGAGEKGKPPKARITVSIDPPQTVVDGKAIALTVDEATCLKYVLDADGDWVSGPDISRDKSIARPDRLLKSAGDKLADKVFWETIPSKGTRLKPYFYGGIITSI